jgi:hypothetical protein
VAQESREPGLRHARRRHIIGPDGAYRKARHVIPYGTSGLLLSMSGDFTRGSGIDGLDKMCDVVGRTNLKFSFLSSTAYQIEGGWLEGGKGMSIWDVYSHTPGVIANGDTGDVADDSFHRYPEDVAVRAFPRLCSSHVIDMSHDHPLLGPIGSCSRPTVLRTTVSRYRGPASCLRAPARSTPTVSDLLSRSCL